ncbi:MAG: amidase [Hyphomicrobiaceae bacterium]|nr:amidase [Hyphomicrobiaceae bacterium]
MPRTSARTIADPLPTATELAAATRSGRLSPVETVAAARARIEALDGKIGAFIALDWTAVGKEAARLARLPAKARGPLHGVPVAIKDMYDTVDFPTGYGSPIYAGNRPAADAAMVARLRAAGAIVVGKTVSTEFAFWKPGKTRHPLDPKRSPGGSSSGSAAAVASGMVPLATGTQTAASVIRPAAYCGVVGFKPTRGLISLAGCKALSNALDTGGVLAGTVADAGLMAGVVTARLDWMDIDPARRPPGIALATTIDWATATPYMLAAIEGTCNSLARRGAKVAKRAAPAAFQRLAAVQSQIMTYEIAREYAFERQHHWRRLSGQMQSVIAEGEAMSPAAYDKARQQAAEAADRLDEMFADADILVSPSAPGEAPLFTEGTGNPVFSRAWTLLGLPTITLPIGAGPSGLPLGLQLAARPGKDLALLAAAAWVERALAEET